jgi:hypothetical protein
MAVPADPFYFWTRLGKFGPSNKGHACNLEIPVSNSFQKRYFEMPHPIRARAGEAHPQRKF